jgi:hypothetical protein
MTSAHSTQHQDQLTLFAGDSLAKTSARQASKPASKKAPALACSTNSCESFAWWDRNTSSWRTSQRSLLTDWTLYSERWPTQGLMLSGRAFRRQMWAPAIGVIGGGVLRTPTTHDTRRRGVNSEQRGLSNTEDWLTPLPTPKACDGERGRDKARARPDTKGRELATVVRDQMLPTPTASLGVSGGSNCAGVRRPENLASAVKTTLAVPQVYQGQARKRMLPTPTTNDSKNASLPPSQAERDGLAGAMLRDDSIPTGAATYLNPSFVEEMMGFPVGWTA